jgi:hypothetical protein
MENIAIRITRKDVFKFIRRRLPPALFAECVNCGALMINAMDLARYLHTMNESLWATIRAITWQIIELEPPIASDLEWEEWDKGHHDRNCGYLMEGYSPAYINKEDVILYNSKECGCFDPLLKRHAIEIDVDEEDWEDQEEVPDDSTDNLWCDGTAPAQQWEADAAKRVLDELFQYTQQYRSCESYKSPITEIDG